MKSGRSGVQVALSLHKGVKIYLYPFFHGLKSQFFATTMDSYYLYILYSEKLDLLR